MGAIAHSKPNYVAAVIGSAGSTIDPDLITPDQSGNYPPIQHSSGLPTNNLVGSINGLLSGVLAYAGVQLFVEFLAEMRRPRDFLKYQGQYTYNPSFQGVAPFGWQTVGNSISLLAGLIAAGLYGNIGIKVFYNNILVEWFKAPLLVSRPGKLIFAAIVPIWWSIAFIIAASIPDYFGFVSVISASMLLNLTYTIPPFLALGYDLQRMSMELEGGEVFDPATGHVRRTGSAVQRYMRGFTSGTPLEVARNIWHVLYFLCSLAMCGLGMYAAVQG
ncbi:hypothetical protein ANO11243_049370 [Dothideomycetidae sp. 11243]|nr:hypothetical protein ANO11243_049370 [fungal sp. No.11243]